MPTNFWDTTLEEARGAQTRRDKAAKFSIALKEGLEAQYWLKLMVATSLAPAELVNPVLAEAGELIAILTVTRRKLSRKGKPDPNPDPSWVVATQTPDS
jgi:four helix bundle protein